MTLVLCFTTAPSADPPASFLHHRWRNFVFDPFEKFVLIAFLLSALALRLRYEKAREEWLRKG